MLTQYKNIQSILNTTNGSSFGLRFSDSELKLLNRSIQIINESAFKNTELHVYSGDTWITGKHDVTLQHSVPSFTDPDTNRLLQLTGTPLSIDLYKHLSDLDLTAGNFKFVINFFRDLIGSYKHQYLVIDEISPDRTELRLRVIDINDTELLKQLTYYTETVQRRHTSKQYYTQYLLNFSRNKTLSFVNSVVIGEYIYIKLYEALPDNLNVNFKCWIVQEQKLPYIDNFSIQPVIEEKTYNTLSKPNWLASADHIVSSDTGIKNWNDLLGSSVQTSQQIIDAYFSGSLSGIKLNIDYTDFNNFIFYSSAEDRLDNFKYKLELLEYYDSQIATLQTISGSDATTNITDYTTIKQKLTGGFDNFEKFLYYESSSKLTTNEIPHESPVVVDLTGSYLTPVPKINSTYPYTSYSTTSSIFTQWFASASSNAQLYDTKNINKLSKSLPAAILQNDAAENGVTFVNMLGHHFDILHTYIKHTSLLYKREENPKLGLPNELLHSVAKQFGWNLQDGNQYLDLWQYVLGTNEAGTPLTGSNTVGDPSVPGKDMTYTVWRRIVNNLPLLLKSKGTKRSVQALLSCYGIPNSLISINEYGGPRIDRAPIYEKLNFDYALDLINNSAGNVRINYGESIGSYEMRFRTDDVITNPLIPTTMLLANINGTRITLHYEGGTYGTIRINNSTESEARMNFFDGEWTNLLINSTYVNVDNILNVYAYRSKYGKIVSTASASVTASFGSTPGFIELGTTGSYYVPFAGGYYVTIPRLNGQLQEVRLWSNNLSLDAFANHTKAPSAYNGTSDAYSELIFRLPLTQKVNHTTTSSLLGVQPKTSTISASFSGWSTTEPYDSIEETYYFDGVSLGAGTYDDNKIRIESSTLIGNLDIKTRAERSQYDTAPLDSKKLGVYFSPQTMIDEDIIAQLGFTELDSYIGDPGDSDKNSYPLLKWKSREYWKKYTGTSDINSYIRIFSLFDLSFFKQLDQLLPARADKLTGLLIQPNLLERNKDSLLPVVSRTDNTYEVNFNVFPDLTGSSDYHETIIHNIAYLSGGEYSYTSNINGNIYSLTAYDDDQLLMNLSALGDTKYNGFNYSYTYLTRSGSTYITASAPYWQSEFTCPAITGSRVSKRFKQIETYYSASIVRTRLVQSDVSEYIPTRVARQRYNGAKMTSADFNIKSNDTYDGGPVAEIITTNPNQLIYDGGPTKGRFTLGTGASFIAAPEI